MKKIFSGKKITKGKIIEFLDKKGFYVVLITCVVVIGITAFLIVKGPIDRSYENEDYISGSTGEEFGNDAEDYAAGTDHEEAIWSPGDTIVSDTESGSPDLADDDADNETDGSSSSVTNEETGRSVLPGSAETDGGQKGQTEKFIMPVYGEITLDFAMDRLLYSKTLDSWRTHSGIDIASSLGTPVKAVADGVVTQIKRDPRYGITIIIEHDSGLKTVYCNLANDRMVVPNQKVKQGDVISSIGDTALFEISEPAHLHFEVWKDDVPVDPKDYLSPGA